MESRTIAIIQGGLRSLRSRGGFREAAPVLSRVAAFVLPACLNLYIVAGINYRVSRKLTETLTKLNEVGGPDPERIYGIYEELLTHIQKLTSKSVWESKELLANFLDMSVRLIKKVGQDMVPKTLAETVEHEFRKLEEIGKEIRSSRDLRELRTTLKKLDNIIRNLSSKLTVYMEFLTYMSYGLYSATGSELMHAFSVVFYTLRTLYKSLNRSPIDLVKGMSCILTASTVTIKCALSGKASENDVKYVASYSLWSLYFMNATEHFKDSEWIRIRYDLEALFRQRDYRLSSAILEIQLFREIGLDAIRHIMSVTDIDLARGLAITREEEREIFMKLIEGR